MNLKLLCIALVFLGLFCTIKSDSIIAIDAGSSGTRLFIVTEKDDGSFGDVECKEDKNVKLATLIGGGDAERAAFITGVAGLAEACKAKIADIETKKISNVILFSTAGSRDMIIKNKKDDYKTSKLNAVLGTDLVNVIKTHIKDAEGKTMSIDVVSGRYEGLYGFFALYLNLKINKKEYRTKICGELDV